MSEPKPEAQSKPAECNAEHAAHERALEGQRSHILDFTSPQFDALAALQAPGLEPPVPDAVPLDNISKCRAILPPELSESLANAAPVAPATQEAKDKAAALKRRAQRAVQAARDSVFAPTLPQILEAATGRGGPVVLLARWLEAGTRVMVVVRHARGVRGRAYGRLAAFDRHMNLVLAEVEEEYTVLLRTARPLPPRGASAAARPPQQPPASDSRAPGSSRGTEPTAPPVGDRGSKTSIGCQVAAETGSSSAAAASSKASNGKPGNSNADRVRWSRTQEHRRRHLAKVLVRGDSVVMVAAAPTTSWHHVQ